MIILLVNLCFLNAITNDCKKVDRRLHAGYEKYIQKNKLLFKTFIKEEDIFRFNQQGEIRSIFDDDGLKPDKYLSNFYPNKINAFKYRNKVEQEIEKLFDALQKSFLMMKILKNYRHLLFPQMNL